MQAVKFDFLRVFHWKEEVKNWLKMNNVDDISILMCQFIHALLFVFSSSESSCTNDEFYE